MNHTVYPACSTEVVTRQPAKSTCNCKCFFQRCVPLTRNVMYPSGVMFASQVMCASRVRRAERITSFCAAGAIHHYASAQHHCGEAATSLFDFEVFQNFVDAFPRGALLAHHFGSVAGFEHAKGLKCLQNCGIALALLANL